jgi:hypothetical protein
MNFSAALCLVLAAYCFAWFLTLIGRFATLDA